MSFLYAMALPTKERNHIVTRYTSALDEMRTRQKEISYNLDRFEHIVHQSDPKYRRRHVCLMALMRRDAKARMVTHRYYLRMEKRLSGAADWFSDQLEELDTQYGQLERRAEALCEMLPYNIGALETAIVTEQLLLAARQYKSPVVYRTAAIAALCVMLSISLEMVGG